MYLRLAVVVLLAVNALFWGLFPHSKHCAFAGLLGVKECPPHSLHIAMGVLFFLLAVLVAQWSHFTKKK